MGEGGGAHQQCAFWKGIAEREGWRERGRERERDYYSLYADKLCAISMLHVITLNCSKTTHTASLSVDSSSVLQARQPRAQWLLPRLPSSTKFDSYVHTGCNSMHPRTHARTHVHTYMRTHTHTHVDLPLLSHHHLTSSL